MSSAKDERAANKKLVIDYMTAAQAADTPLARSYLAEDCVRVFPRPGLSPSPITRGRDKIMGNRPHLSHYKPGSMKMEVEQMVAEGPYVAVQFIIRAETAAGEAYENSYHHLYECHDGKIANYWEYCDVMGGARLLRPEALKSPAVTPILDDGGPVIGQPGGAIVDPNDETGPNKILVLRYQNALQAGDLEGTRACLSEDCVRVMPRPGVRADPFTVGRDAILGDLPHLALYRGPLKMEVERIVGEGDFVAIQFVIRGTTAAGKAYENFYHFLFECHDGRITRFYEHCDTLYGARMLRPEMFAA